MTNKIWITFCLFILAIPSYSQDYNKLFEGQRFNGKIKGKSYLYKIKSPVQIRFIDGTFFYKDWYKALEGTYYHGRENLISFKLTKCDMINGMFEQEREPYNLKTDEKDYLENVTFLNGEFNYLVTKGCLKIYREAVGGKVMIKLY